MLHLHINHFLSNKYHIIKKRRPVKNNTRQGRFHMRRALIIMGSIIGCLIVISIFLVNPVPTNRAAYGKADLTHDSLSGNSKVSLDGKWEFYWNQLLDPDSFSESNTQMDGYAEIPQYWNSSNEYPSNGMATYRLLVTLPDQSERLAISMPKVYAQYRLWVNGQLLCDSDLDEKNSAFYLTPAVYCFDTNGNQTIEIILQIRNTQHIYAGIGQSIVIGSEEALTRSRMISLSVDMSISTLCVLSSLYSFAIFINKKNQKAYFWFSLVSLFVGFRGLMMNQNFIMILWPKLSFDLGSRIASALIPLIALSLLMYLRAVYARKVPNLLYYTILLTSTVFLALITFLPTTIILMIFNMYMVITISLCILLLYLSFYSLLIREQGDVLFAFGSCLFFMGAVCEGLWYYQKIDTWNFLSFGLAGFALTQTIYLVQYYSRIETDSIILQKRLQITDLAYLRAQIRPHFIYNALAAISSTISRDPKEAKKLLLDFSDYLRGCFSLEREDGLTTIHNEMSMVFAYASVEKARFRDRIHLEYDLQAKGDSLIPVMSIQPLVENAIRHGITPKIDGGTVKISSWNKDGETHVIVEDDGIGFSLFGREKGPDGDGIGIININRRLEMLYNTHLRIDSEIGRGTRIEMVVPMRK